jgi:uncharacterized protein (DUF1330 family)
MTAYAVADLHKVEMGPAIVEYLERIDATLAPFGGRYIIHGGRKTVLEGEWAGDLIVIAFPDRASAAGWYASPEYQAIKPRRTDHSEGDVVLVDGVGAEHRATDVLATAVG